MSKFHLWGIGLVVAFYYGLDCVKAYFEKYVSIHGFMHFGYYRLPCLFIFDLYCGDDLGSSQFSRA